MVEAPRPAQLEPVVGLPAPGAEDLEALARLGTVLPHPVKADLGVEALGAPLQKHAVDVAVGVAELPGEEGFAVGALHVVAGEDARKGVEGALLRAHVCVVIDDGLPGEVRPGVRAHVVGELHAHHQAVPHCRGLLDAEADRRGEHDGVHRPGRDDGVVRVREFAVVEDVAEVRVVFPVETGRLRCGRERQRGEQQYAEDSSHIYTKVRGF